MRRGAKVVLGLVVVAAAAGGVAFTVRANGNGQAEGPPAVAVARGDLVDRALAIGTIEPVVEISVKSKVSGVVQRRFADVGDYVRAGDPLLEIKPDPTPLELVETRRQVQLRELELENMETELGRQQALLEKGHVSQQDFDATQRRHAEARLQLQMARERLALLEEGKVKMAGGGSVESVVRSPISGFVLEKMVEIGDPVVPLSTYQEGTVLMKMADMKELIFRGTVDEIDVGRLAEGMPAEIKVGALPGAPVRGVLSMISPKARKQENATIFPIEVRLTDAGGALLRAGFSANAEIVIERREQVIAIPERLVTFQGDSTWVMVERGDGTAERRVIQTGLSDAIKIEVISGLGEGERVREKPAKKI